VGNQGLTPKGEPEHAGLDRQLEEIAWGILLVMIGLLWFFPEGMLPRDIWLVGSALIILGLNLARYLSRLRVNVFMTVLGLIALAAGVGGIYGVHLRLLPLLPILIGAQLLVRPLMRKISSRRPPTAQA
jgi:hypothetical protein